MSQFVFEALEAELAFNVAAFYNPDVDQELLNKQGCMQMVLMVNANYHGSLEEAEAHLAPFLASGPLQQEHLVVPWPRVFSTSYFGAAPLTLGGGPSPT
ncbi:hypothetical protein DL767_001941 [Monosporascus sp. MG133]|nr:hypothetical protein DL767_001941 [Monosporascus sp. MG133]